MRKNKTKDKVLVIQKFKNSHRITALLLIVFFIILFLYILTLVLLQLDNTSTNRLFDNNILVLLNVLKDSFLVIISIVGTTLLTATLIEKNQKNTTYTELLANNIFASPEFYSNLTEENKQKMIENLEKNYYDRFSIKQELYSVFRDSLNNMQYDYYYEECNYNISFFPKPLYSEKTIVRTMKIRSYDEEITIPKLHLCGYSLSPTEFDEPLGEKLDAFEFISLSIDGVTKSKDDIIITQSATTDQLLNKCGYSIFYSVDLKENIKITSNSDVVIRIEYKSRVTDDDNSMSFRVSVPCRKYYLNFYAPEDYKVVAHAFGTFDVASNSSNGLYDNTISVKFDNWLLPENGVTICCFEKSNSHSSVEREVLYR